MLREVAARPWASSYTRTRFGRFVRAGRLANVRSSKQAREKTVNRIIYIVGLVVVIIAVLSFFGLR